MSRSDESELLTQARFRSLVEESILPPPGSVDFMRTAKGEFILRFGAQQPHIAELFQENTKLTPWSTLTVPSDDEELDAARRLYFTTSFRIRDEDLEAGQEHRIRRHHKDLPAPLRELCAPLAEPGKLSALLYSVDLMMLHDGQILRQVPEADYLWVERTLHPDEQDRLRASILRVSRGVLQRTKVFLFLLAAPWRYMMLFGPRGYRRMLLEMGALFYHLEAEAHRLGLGAIPCQDFYDARIDELLMLDGTERSTLAILALPGDEPHA